MLGAGASIHHVRAGTRMFWVESIEIDVRIKLALKGHVVSMMPKKLIHVGRFWVHAWRFSCAHPACVLMIHF